MRGKRVLVSGAAGFVGANLTRALLQQGAQIHVLIRPRTNLWRIEELCSQLTLHMVDLTQRSKLHGIVKAIQPELIFHLATDRNTHSPEERWRTVQSNVLGLVNLLDATASVSYERFLHFGGSLEYGTKDRPMQESDVLAPVTFYGATKAAATLLCQQSAQVHQWPLVILRLFSVYGYWEDAMRLIPTAVLNSLHGQDIMLTPPGSRRDFTFVEDVIEACFLAVRAQLPSGEILNIGSGQQWSNEEVVEVIQELTGRASQVRLGAYPNRPTDTHQWVADNQKVRQLLGWAPRHSLRRGLEKTVTWFVAHQNLYPTL